jgi:hypothetical protein
MFASCIVVIQRLTKWEDYFPVVTSSNGTERLQENSRERNSAVREKIIASKAAHSGPLSCETKSRAISFSPESRLTSESAAPTGVETIGARQHPRQALAESRFAHGNSEH